MPFVTHLDASADVNRRDSERRLVNSVFAAWSGRGAPFTVIVHNISETGFRAEFASELQVGDEVRLRLGTAGYVSAEVVWRDGWDHGCRFLTPILAEEVREAMTTLTPVVVDNDSEDGIQPLTKPERSKFSRKTGLRIALLIVGLFVLVEGFLMLKLLF